MEEHELTAVIEALLFVSGEPLAVERLVPVLEGIAAERIVEALDRLKQGYDAAGRGLQIVEVAGGYQISTRPECSPWLKAFEKIKSATRLSRSGLETLAIVAYKQPVTRGEIEVIRGVDSAGVLKTLLERRILKIVGRREGLGRPMLYGTTREFLHYFGLKDLSELPALREFKEVAETLPAHEPIHEPASELTN